MCYPGFAQHDGCVRRDLTENNPAMLLSDLSTISEEALRLLIEDGAVETGTLEFKRQLPGTTDAEKAELAKDVTGLPSVP